MLLNKYLPQFQFNEIHTTIVKGNSIDSYNATMELDLSDSKIITILFRLRCLPFANKKLAEVTKDMRFTLLEEIRYSEFLYAFWFTTKTEWIEDKNEFEKNNSKNSAKVGWSFRFNERSDSTTEIITETRILCLNTKTKYLFSIYWFFIKPFSGLIRLEMLRLIKKKLNNIIK
jgi:hypothetical protein